MAEDTSRATTTDVETWADEDLDDDDPTTTTTSSGTTRTTTISTRSRRRTIGSPTLETGTRSAAVRHRRAADGGAPEEDLPGGGRQGTARGRRRNCRRSTTATGHAFTVVEFGGGWQIATRPEYSPVIEQLLQTPALRATVQGRARGAGHHRLPAADHPPGDRRDPRRQQQRRHRDAAPSAT